MGKTIFKTIGQVFLLSLLFLCYSIPLITFGASCTALYYCTREIAAGNTISVISTFKRIFKSNFILATKHWTTFLVWMGLSIIFYFFFLYMFPTSKFFLQIILFCIFSIMEILITYLYTILGVFDSSSRDYIHMAIFLLKAHPCYSILLIGINLTPLFILLWTHSFWLSLIISLLLIGPIATVQSVILNEILKKHLLK